jgi:hypothetical protein
MRWDAHSNVSGSSARAKLFKAASCRTKDCGGAKKFHSRQLKKSGNGKNPCGPSPVRKAGVNRSSVSSGQRMAATRPRNDTKSWEVPKTARPGAADRALQDLRSPRAPLPPAPTTDRAGMTQSFPRRPLLARQTAPPRCRPGGYAPSLRVPASLPGARPKRDSRRPGPNQ